MLNDAEDFHTKLSLDHVCAGCNCDTITHVQGMLEHHLRAAIVEFRKDLWKNGVTAWICPLVVLQIYFFEFVSIGALGLPAFL